MPFISGYTFAVALPDICDDGMTFITGYTGFGGTQANSVRACVPGYFTGFLIMKLFGKQYSLVVHKCPSWKKAYKRLIKNQYSYLHSTGWLRSLEESQPVDETGRPVPWMNYTVVEILRDRLTSDMRLFEYGSGYSTIFYADRVESVVSIEYDEEWFDLVRSQAPGNVDVVFCSKDIDGDYCRSIHRGRTPFDVVVVDGRDRVNCVKQSLPALSDRGVLLLDDSQRERYAEAIDFARDNGFKTLDIAGLKPGSCFCEQTTILYRPGNCFDI